MKLDQSFNWRLFVRNRRYLLYAIGVGLFGIGMIFQASIPLVNAILSTNKSIETETKMVNQLQQKATRLQSLNGEDVSESQTAVNAVLPSKKPVLELLAGLSIVAERSEVSFTDFAVSPGEIATNSAETSALAAAKKRKSSKDSALAYDTVTVQLTAEGSFDQVQTFLASIEQIAPFTTVTDLDLSIRRSQVGVVQSSDFVSAEMMLDTHYYTQSLKAALTTPLPETTAQHEQVLTDIQPFIFPTLDEQREVVDQGMFDLFGINTNQLLEQINQ